MRERGDPRKDVIQMDFVISGGEEIGRHAVNGEDWVGLEGGVVVTQSERGDLRVEINVRVAVRINECASM